MGEEGEHPLDAELIRLGQSLFSGRIDMDLGPWRGSIHFAQGQVLDARIGPFVGEPALWRMLLPHAGSPRIEPGRARASDGVVLGQPAALVERFREREELLGRLAERVGGFSALWAVRFDVLRRRLDELPDAINPFLRLLDGRRTVRQVVAETPVEDVMALRILSRLLAMGVLEFVGTGVPVLADAPSEEILIVGESLESALLKALEDAPATAHDHEAALDDGQRAPHAVGVAPSPEPKRPDELGRWLGRDEPRPPSKVPAAVLDANSAGQIRVTPTTLGVLLCAAGFIGAVIVVLLR
jgi:hypothetical protein